MSRVKLRELDPRGSLSLTGSLGVSGSFSVDSEGPIVFKTENPNEPTLVISGALEIVKAEVQNQIASASLSIQNLGTLSDRSSNSTIDLGGFF
jgi:hypothetical protein